MKISTVTVNEFQRHFEQLVPSGIAWNGDNVGILVGSGERTITNVVIALDVTAEVIAEAKRKKANLIVTHHPLIFHPLKQVTPRTRVGKLVLALAENTIALFAAHTNLDSVPWGVSGALAQAIGLTDTSVLSPAEGRLRKITVFVPEQHVESVAEAMHDAGAGMFARYDRCSFRSSGTGTFRGKEGATPYIGTVGTMEKVPETRLEMIVESWKLSAVLDAMLKAHPYEEAAYDILPLTNAHPEFGLGIIGTLPRPLSQRQFLTLVKQRLGVSGVRFSGHREAIRRVAVCGGSGTELIDEAVSRNADAFVTADVKYHTFQDAEDRLLLVDAGHYETEQVVLPVLGGTVKRILEEHGSNGKVFVTRHSTNPVQLF